MVINEAVESSVRISISQFTKIIRLLEHAGLLKSESLVSDPIDAQKQALLSELEVTIGADEPSEAEKQALISALNSANESANRVLEGMDRVHAEHQALLEDMRDTRRHFSGVAG